MVCHRLVVQEIGVSAQTALQPAVMRNVPTGASTPSHCNPPYTVTAMLHTASDCTAGVNTNPVMPSGLPESEREGILPEPYEQTAVHKNSGSKQTAAPAQRPTIIQSFTDRTQAKVQDTLNRSQNVKVIARWMLIPAASELRVKHVRRAAGGDARSAYAQVH